MGWDLTVLMSNDAELRSVYLLGVLHSEVTKSMTVRPVGCARHCSSLVRGLYNSLDKALTNSRTC